MGGGGGGGQIGGKMMGSEVRIDTSGGGGNFSALFDKVWRMCS